MIRVQIQYQTGRDPRPTGAGWVTIDGQEPPVVGPGRNAWARQVVSDTHGHPDVSILGVYVGETDDSMADHNSYERPEGVTP